MRYRTITIECVGTRLPFTEYAISCEQHDAYIYLAKSIDEAIEKYEEDRNCTVGKVYNVDGSLIFDKSNVDEFFEQMEITDI